MAVEGARGERGERDGSKEEGREVEGLYYKNEDRLLRPRSLKEFCRGQFLYAFRITFASQRCRARETRE